MVKFAAGVALGATLSCALASAAQTVRHNGAFWKGLAKADKTAYVAGFSDATHVSLGKLDQLKVAAGLFHWKGANKILTQAERGLDLSDLPTAEVVTYLDGLYSNPRYGDFDVANAIGLAVMRGEGANSTSQSAAVAPDALASDRQNKIR